MLTKRMETDQIAIVGPYRQLQLRVATIIERDGVEISRDTSIETLDPDADVSGRGTFARAVANAVWTPEVRERWQNRPRPGGPPEERPTPPADRAPPR